jgi:hypothetical protein
MDVTVLAIDKAGPDLTTRSLVTAVENIKGYQDIFGGPPLSFSAKEHLGSHQAADAGEGRSLELRRRTTRSMKRSGYATHAEVGMIDLVQLIVSGVAVGSIYGLVALGFVLVYKATETINFAQGDLLMLGAFVAFTLIVSHQMPFWIGFVLAILVLMAFGYGLDALVLRKALGRPQFAVVMLTIGLGAMFRSAASMIWGAETRQLPTPYGIGKTCSAASRLRMSAL